MKKNTRKFIFLLSFIFIFILISILISIFLISPKATKVGTAFDKSQKVKDFGPHCDFKGKIIFQSNFDGDNEIYLMTNKGIQKLTDNTWEDEYPVWSHDGKKIAFSSNEKGNFDIYIMNPDGTEITPITSSLEDERDPFWFPDDKTIGYTKEIKQFLRKTEVLFKLNINTKRTAKIIPNYSSTHAIANHSPVAPLVVFTGKRRFGWDVGIYDVQQKEVKFLEEGGKSCRARFSKDGKKLAYVSSKADGKGDIWLMNPDGSHKALLTKTTETYDYFPSWSPDGKHIVFNSSIQYSHSGDWKICIIEVSTKKVFLLFDSPGNDVFPDWHK
ncbi:MAG: PD40 domain-containing protein [Candidatus Aminicenantes bacterium]|nr:PD40 domain-containing protein [Candidatus Aminicenantes bacterium]